MRFLLTQHFDLRGFQKHHFMHMKHFAWSTDGNSIEFATYEETTSKTCDSTLTTQETKSRSSKDGFYRWTEVSC